MAEPTVIWDAADLAFLKEQAAETPRQRCRLCAHPASDDPLHEMLIIHGREAYVRPHRHIGRSESFQVIEGEATAVFFADDGSVDTAVSLAAPANGGAFYYRVPENTFHTLIIQSDWLVFYESTQGPFDPACCEFSDWAPDGSDDAAARTYINELASSIRSGAPELKGTSHE